MKIIKQQRSILGLAVIAGLILSFSSCKKDKDPIPDAPVITILEIGSGNSHTVTAGSDLHLEAQIVAEAGIKEIEIDIHGEDGIHYSINHKYTDGKYIGAKNIEFHEHIVIPHAAPAGSYHLHFIVTDQKGQSTEADADLTINHDH